MDAVIVLDGCTEEEVREIAGFMYAVGLRADGAVMPKPGSRPTRRIATKLAVGDGPLSGNIDLGIAEGDWRPESKDTPGGWLHIQVVSVRRAEPPIDGGWVWVEGWRYLSEESGTPIRRELVKFRALPPELRAKVLPVAEGSG